MKNPPAAADARIAALDVATRAIAGELDLERVLQVIVDSVRDLVRARYAALGIPDATGRIERFITSGLSYEARLAIGAPPRGLGLIGLIIREGRSYRIADVAAHPDARGFPANHPKMTSFLGVPVRVRRGIVGNLYLTDKVGNVEFSEDDQRLVEMFATHAGIALENARLHAAVRHLAVVDERDRIGRDLHDGLMQGIYAVALSLEDVPDLMHEDPAEATARIDRAIDRLNLSIREMRSFIQGLGSQLNADIGLVFGLATLGDELRLNTLIDVEVDLADGDAVADLLSHPTADHLLQIAREALSNIARHSGASRATLSLRREGNDAVLVVTDNGRGFEPSEAAEPGHYGLANLRERAAAIGGQITIDSEPGQGTRIIVRLQIIDREAQPT
jgi:signal transduction histidine kinase